ncbi:hypothetical protein BJY00DRAFT_289376 [Aspergillus carlsbadensis]|nr:hypothetical protein BJY00DRAFT_289376 [Aspergillus carlsbadensis]
MSPDSTISFEIEPSASLQLCARIWVILWETRLPLPSPTSIGSPVRLSLRRVMVQVFLFFMSLAIFSRHQHR